MQRPPRQIVGIIVGEQQINSLNQDCTRARPRRLTQTDGNSSLGARIWAQSAADSDDERLLVHDIRSYLFEIFGARPLLHSMNSTIHMSNILFSPNLFSFGLSTDCRRSVLIKKVSLDRSCHPRAAALESAFQAASVERLYRLFPSARRDFGEAVLAQKLVHGPSCANAAEPPP